MSAKISSLAKPKKENLSRFVLDNPNPVLRIDASGRVVYRNNAVDIHLKKLAYSKNDVNKILPKNLMTLLKKTQKSNKPLFDIELRVKDKTYSYCISYEEEKGYFNLYALDISELRFEEEQIESEIELENLNHNDYEQIINDSNELIEQDVARRTSEIEKNNLKLKKHIIKLESKLKRIDEKRVPLTDKEKLAFYGLVRYPELSSKEVAERIGLPSTTVNSIKKRLIREGYFQTMIIPRFDLLGCKLMSINYLSWPKIPKDDVSVPLENKTEFLEKLNLTPELLFSSSSEKSSIFLSASEDWDQYMEMESSFGEDIRKYEIEFGQYQTIHFPTNKSVIDKYFSFAPLLRDRFKLDVEDSIEAEPSYKEFKISSTEKKFIYGLMKYPNSTVVQLSKAINISVPTICKLRKRLLKEGLIQVVNFPDLKKMGMELLVLNHYELHTQISGTDNKIPCKNPNIFFAVANKAERITMALYKDYTEAEKRSSNCFVNSGKICGKSNRIIIPLENVYCHKLEFGSLVRKMFSLAVNY